MDKYKQQHDSVKARTLLDSLLDFLAIKGKKVSLEGVLSGLPIVNNELNLDLFKRAARRCGFSSKKQRLPLKEIHAVHLPVILVLHDQKACVVTKVLRDSVELVSTHSGQIVSSRISISELKKQYAGIAITMDELHRLDERTREFFKKLEKHWFWSVVGRYWGTYSEVLVASFVINLFAIAVPLFVLNVYDRVIPNSAIETLWVLSVGMVIVIGFEFLMRTLRVYYIDTVGRRVDLKLSAKTFAQVLGLSMDDRPNSVGTLAKTVQSFETFREFITSATISLLVDIPFSLLFIVVIFLISPILVLVPLIAVPLILVNSYFLQKAISDRVMESYRYSAETQALLVEAIAHAENIKYLNAEGIHQKKWEDIVDISSSLSIKIRRLTNFGLNFALSIQFLALISLVIAGVYTIWQGNLTMGGLIACTILNGRALSPVVQLANLIIRYKRVKASLDALDAIMQKKTDRYESLAYIQLSKIKGLIEFKEVELTYPDEPVPVLKNVSLRIMPGTKVGIVGRAGSGKSTLCKVLLKLYQPQKGGIFIDEIDIRQIDPSILRKNIGYLPQTISLFHGTIRDNITMGIKNYSDDDLLMAAKISGVHSFVHNHPDGYERQVGESGSYLSGGERQAVAIARTVVNHPQIYIFDEPTNSLDNTRIKHFIQNMSKIIHNKTFIVITHKMEILNKVDYLIVMDRGEVYAQGLKEEVLDLLKKNKKTD